MDLKALDMGCHENNIDFLATQYTADPARDFRAQPGRLIYRMRDFHEQVYITSTSIIVYSRAEQAHLRVVSCQLFNHLADNFDLICL